MNDDEFEDVGQLWDDIMDDVKQTIKNKLKSIPLNESQIEFIHDMCTEQMYHAGWDALREFQLEKTL